MEQQGTDLTWPWNSRIKGFVAEIPGKVDFENGHGIIRQYWMAKVDKVMWHCQKFYFRCIGNFTYTMLPVI